MNSKITDTAYLPEGSLLGREENIYYTSDLSRLGRAMAAGRCDCRTMDLTVEVGQYRGVIPRDECVYDRDGGEVRDIAIITRVGKAAAFKVQRIEQCDDGRPCLILSRRAAQEECARRYISRLVPGDIIPATVTHMEPFGAFVDIGCVIV